MLDLLIKDGIVSTQNNTREIKKTNIGVTGGIITYLGGMTPPAKKIIEGNNYLVTPAFINAHIHFGEYYLRGYRGKLSTEQYILLGEKFHRQTADISDIVRKSSIRNVVAESIRNGVLTFLGTRGWPYVQEFPVNAYLGCPLMNSEKLSHYSNDFEKNFTQLPQAANIEYFIGLHSLGWTSENILARLGGFLADNPQIKLSLHFCETKEEVKAITSAYGMTPVEVLKKHGLLNSNTLLVHCNYVTGKDVDSIAESGASIAVCHTSNLKLGNAPCNINRLLKNNINVMIATDGPATNDSLSLLESAKLSALLSNLDEQQAFDMITVTPARYLNTNTGSIVEGNKADLLFYDLGALSFTYTKSVMSNLIFSPGIIPQIVIKNGIIIETDFEKIKQEKNEIIKILETKGVEI